MCSVLTSTFRHPGSTSTPSNPNCIQNPTIGVSGEELTSEGGAGEGVKEGLLEGVGNDDE